MAAGATYEPIATTTLGSDQTDITFSSIPATYTDLVFVVQAQSTVAGTSVNTMRCRINGDTGTNYSYTNLDGEPPTAASGRETSVTYFVPGNIPQTSATSRNLCIFSIMNYANTTTYKTILSRGNTQIQTNANVALWRSTAAINSVTISRNFGAGEVKTGSIVSVYGIAAA
jgi:hypothetical protein